uniref:Uncharacterized protein n=1 Tax=Anguilla anguilla TaxID=7936 RepID=A0A0E9RWE7_ANGAN
MLHGWWNRQTPLVCPSTSQKPEDHPLSTVKLFFLTS